MRYWAYKHIDGGIHLKTYREDAPHAKASIEDACKSGFVSDVVEPFEAESRTEAETIVRARLASNEAKG